MQTHVSWIPAQGRNDGGGRIRFIKLGKPPPSPLIERERAFAVREERGMDAVQTRHTIQREAGQAVRSGGGCMKAPPVSRLIRRVLPACIQPR